MLVKSYKKTLANENRTKEARDLQKFNEKPNHCLVVIPIVRTMKVKMYIMLNLFGPQMINLEFVVLLTRFTKIGKKDSLLMYPNARVYLMNYIKMDTLRCSMSYRRLKN